MRYMWEDSNTGIVVEVSRSSKDIEQAPDKDEAMEAGMDIEDFAHADWKRVIKGAPAFVGPRGKGYW